MSLLVYTDEHSFGALSLYCGTGCRFDADDVAVAQALAGHLSVVMAAEKQIDQLGLALHNRNIIGQAQGVLMERYDMTADQAFDYLRRISSNTNMKVAIVAAEIARTRRIPDASDGRPGRPLLDRPGLATATARAAAVACASVPTPRAVMRGPRMSQTKGWTPLGMGNLCPRISGHCGRGPRIRNTSHAP